MLDPYIEAFELRELLRKREVRPREVAEFFLSRIEKLNPRLGTFVTVTAERALAEAKRLEELSREQADAMALYGIPYTIKDLTWTAGVRTTFGSANYADFIPPADAEVVVRLGNAGGTMLGKTSTPEFGTRPTTEGGFCPTARNPWNLERTAGGSSGGAAAAASAGLGLLHLGSDGGGSIRIPASCCGIVGVKTSRGRITYAPSHAEGWGGCSVMGPMARSVRDAALMLDAIAGPVVGDPYWAAPPPRLFVKAVEERPGRLRLAALRETPLASVEEETLQAFDSACREFRAMGHEVERVDIDLTKMLESYGVVVVAGISSNRIAEPEKMDPVARAPWQDGQKITAAQYLQALTAMQNAARELVQALHRYDALLTPTLTRPAVKLGTMPSAEPWVIDRLGRRVYEIYTWTAFCFPFNATGQPAISVPMGFTTSGLPLGLQIVGRPADEATIISLAAAFEEARPWRAERPPIE